MLVYDGDCAFCRRWIARWRRVTGERVEYGPYQEVAGRFPALPLERLQSAVQLIEPDGRVLWESDIVGIDGVVLDSAEPPIIKGAGEWDPPGDWRPFALSADSGQLVRA